MRFAFALVALLLATALPAAAAADFRLAAAPSSAGDWTAEVTGDLPVVFVAIKTSATGERRFEGPAIDKVAANRWRWIFTIPPVPGPEVEVTFVAKDPYADVPPEARPVIPYCAGRFAVSATAPPAPPQAPPPGPGGLTGLKDAVDSARIAAFPRPKDDNGRGIHWFPTCSQSRETVDRFVDEVRAMHIKWVLFMNPGSDAQANRYLVERLVASGIMPVMRLYYDNDIKNRRDGAELARVREMVRSYGALGVRYFQHLNEPNLDCEWGGRDGFPPDHIARFCDAWIPVAQAIADAGGIPGLPGPAFGWIDRDGRHRTGEEYLKELLAELLRRGAKPLLARSFFALHNYATNRDPRPGLANGRDGFWEFRAYREILKGAGLEMPMIGGEGGTRPEDVGGDQGKITEWTLFSYRFMKDAPEYLFCFSPWLLSAPEGNEWLKHAWIKPDGSRFPIVEAMKRERPPARTLTTTALFPPVATAPPASGGAAGVADLPDKPILADPLGPRDGETRFPPDGGFADGGCGRQAFLNRMGEPTMVGALLKKMRQVCPEIGQASGFTVDCAVGYYEILNAMTSGGYAFKDSDAFPPDPAKLDAFRRNGPHMDGGREIGIRRVK